jgi:PEGA domain
MTVYRMQRRLNRLLGWILLLAPLLAQTPGKPGRLIINSTPPKATIVINGQTWGELTNAIVVMPPGTYNVSVASSELKNCPTTPVTVQAGSETEVNCIQAGWQK